MQTAEMELMEPGIAVGVADYGSPRRGPNRDTTAARAARTRAKHDRWAEELRAAGWNITAPEDVRCEA